MSDLETMIAMLERAKIEYERHSYTDGTVAITVERGYAGFQSILLFNKSGTLFDMGAYE